MDRADEKGWIWYCDGCDELGIEASYEEAEAASERHEPTGDAECVLVVVRQDPEWHEADEAVAP